MKASDITTDAKTVKEPVVAQTATGNWHEVSAAKLKSWYKQTYGSTLKDLDTSGSTRYFMFVNTQSPRTNFPIALQLVGDQLSSVDRQNEIYGRADGEALRQLVKVTSAKQGERVWGDFILYDGQVFHKQEFLANLPVVGQISTGTIHDVPPNARWALRRLYLKYNVSADRVVVFRNTADDISEPWSCASIKLGQLVNTQSQRKLDAATQVQLSKELTQALGLQQKVSVTTHIVPNTKLQRALQAINDNPGVDRPDLYWTVLKLQQLPAQGTQADVASELVKLGLVTVTKKQYQLYYTINPVGKLVLARVNAGHAVAKASLLK